MEFKIDTKDAFTIIMPTEGTISAKLTDALRQKVEEMRQSGSQNFIIDLQNCKSLESPAIQDLIAIHEESYSLDQSMVFTEVTDNVMTTLKKEEADLAINIAPRRQEAIDIVSMEILERDLLSEE